MGRWVLALGVVSAALAVGLWGGPRLLGLERHGARASSEGVRGSATATGMATATAPEPDPPWPEGLGVATPLEDVSGRALAPLHAALRRARQGEGQARLLFYGASHTACDHVTGHLREGLQERFGDAGRGFALAVWPNDRHYWQRGVRVRQGVGWKRVRLGTKRGSPDHYGLAGVVFDSEGRAAVARIETSTEGVGQRADWLEVWYQTQPGGGDLEVWADGEPLARLVTDAPEVAAGFAPFALEAGPHAIELRARHGAPVRVYGVVLERRAPGVVVDNAGLSGARARFHLKWREPIYSAHLRRRDPDLVGMFYGGNEGNDFNLPIATYARRAERALARVRRAVPEAACMLIGPADKPLRRDGAWVHRSRTTSIARVQRRLAAKHGCAFFDTVAFMGGRLSMLRWVAADPPLGRPDYVHFTARGYERMGQVLLAGLLDGLEGERVGFQP